MLDRLWSDLVFGVRQQLKAPAITAVMIGTLALGIAATSSAFSLLNGFLLRPPAVAAPSSIVRLYDTFANGFQYFTVSYPDFEDIRDLRDVFADAALEEPAAFSVGVAGAYDRIWGEFVSNRYFPALGIAARAGRLFAPTEEVNGERVVVVSESFWKRRLGETPIRDDSAVTLNGDRFRIVGVAPEGFGGMILGFNAEFWVPVEARTKSRFATDLTDRGARGYFAFARLRPGVTLVHARTALDTLAARLQREHPISNAGVKFIALPESEGRVFPMFRGAVVGASAATAIVSVLVLLLACANVAGVLMGRAAARRVEIGVRLALGASRSRIVAQLLTEAVVLSVVAGAAGIALAWQATTFLSVLRVTIARGAPLSVDVGLDARVLAASVFVVLSTAIAFGLAPALDASKADLVLALKDGELRSGVRPSRLRRWLIAGQVALSMLLLAGGGLFVRSLQHARQVDLGFDPASLVTTSIDLHLRGMSADESTRFWNRVLDDVKRLPRTQAASVTTRAPLDIGIVSARLAPEGTPSSDGARWAAIEYGVVDSDYFRTMRIPVLEGRAFTEADARSSNAIILNDVIARQFWPGERAVERYVVNARGERYEVVGVARRSKYMSVGEEPKPYAYFPIGRGGALAATLVARGAGDPGSYLREIGETVRAIAPDVPLYDVATMNDRIRKSMAATIGGAASLSIIALMALALTALGLYGTIAHSVGRRTHEIGVRRALGARDRDVVGLVVRDAVLLVGCGAGAGIAAAILAVPLLRSLLYSVDRFDPVVFGVAPLVLLAAAAAASWVPTWRALRINAAEALRHE
jgi:putative ABC transport system permease protein